MFWFNGTISDAIHLAKQRSFIFVVVIVGEDEQSANLLSSWEDASVSETAHNGCVAVKVDAKSDTCVQFSQIYPVVCIPSSFFIGENGIPLEVIAGSVSATELGNRIDSVKQLHAQQIGKQETTAPTMISTTQPALAPPSVPSVPLKSTEEAVEGLEPGQAAEAAACSQSTAEIGCRDTSLSGPKETNLDAKAQRLNKAEDRQQTALEDEYRGERAARYAKFLEEKAKKVALQKEQAEEEEARKEALLRQRSTITRLQFRLPDGSSITNKFPSQNKLQEAHQFAVQEVGNRFGSFSMATMFPRREFTSEDLHKTFLELDLAPSSTIVLVPCGRASAVVSSSAGGVWAILRTLFYPILSVWRLLSSMMFATEPQETSTSSYTNSASRPDNSKREPLSTPAEKRPKNFKKDGKICQLKTEDDSEDDNNTWNGNSTQQM
ncbi:UBX domain-containing protein 4 [Nerophis ophidion]|uniref:UBX domain-containing protein 4 n=1 Tax=Nerophis ophidion TaxID=159077 RepID=UPI002AE0348C|nr:UBX domain-containing protein 4 [Nerophis ophidion]